ncbi:hypothetical protein ATSB10_36200 [Dyella thiooxydans]|uniref:Methyltransferase FkbM domain-containing protein n=1 Tax=Dyella thiooxydans TaxID=445710 RepID=A0A160N5J6_9GAMM|nr:FkbM family methyltransferase [Dyella thiooxydans]AND71074.1 hypothetical protein ATSB10_36200 [Dyella thiooxydans]
MSFVSYAQNGEDVMLARVLRGIARGFYIDVGAQDPIEHSVTKAFYEAGWHGINIEPVTHWFEMLQRDRPRDINLRMAASDSTGRLRLFEVGGTGLSTTHGEFADRHAQAGFPVSEVEVECRTLDEICAAHPIGVVHFLKIDCEGSEAAVLRGFSFGHIRPWIVLVEATEPLSQKPTHAEWENVVLGHGYHFVYGDGLNRYYVADEKSDLDPAFAYPPNVFDDFVRASDARVRDELLTLREDLVTAQGEARHLREENERREAALVAHRRELASVSEREVAAAADAARSKAEIVWLSGEAMRLSSQVEQLGGEVERLTAEVQLRERELGRLRLANAEIQASTSWRVTYPLRLLRRTARALPRLGRRLAYHVLRWPARLLRPILRFLARSEGLCALCLRAAGPDSWLTARTRLFLFGVPPAVEPATATPSSGTAGFLTKRALQMLAEINDARASREVASRNAPQRGK